MSRFILIVLCVLFSLCGLFFAFFNVLTVPNLSMEPLIPKGARLIVSRLHDGNLERGALVVFSLRKDGENLLVLKRVIGLPGETVKIRGGMASIAGTNWADTFGSNDDVRNAGTAKDNYTIVLSTDEIFVLGDNRGRSFDSRMFGPVKKSDIKYIDPWVIK